MSFSVYGMFLRLICRCGPFESTEPYDIYYPMLVKLEEKL